jgi:hypothetical protein
MSESVNWFLALPQSKQRETIKRAKSLVRWGLAYDLLSALSQLHAVRQVIDDRASDTAYVHNLSARSK